MGLVFALSSRRRLPMPPGIKPELTATVAHFTVYAVLAALLWWALAIPGLAARRRLALAFAGAVAFGVSDEWHQSFVPGREVALYDIAVDALGALAAVVGIAIAIRRRRGVAENRPTG
jgi:VanZ family protein